MVQPQLCLLALRNLCFYGPAKTQLVENGEPPSLSPSFVYSRLYIHIKCCVYICFIERFVSVLNDSMESGEIWKRAVAVSAVWALIHNCTKVWL